VQGTCRAGGGSDPGAGQEATVTKGQGRGLAATVTPGLGGGLGGWTEDGQRDVLWLGVPSFPRKS
jgi:hypothetical protein